MCKVLIFNILIYNNLVHIDIYFLKLLNFIIFLLIQCKVLFLSKLSVVMVSVKPLSCN